MGQEPVPLTPAEQMKRIREAVHTSDSASSKKAHEALATYFARLDVLNRQIVNLESKMEVREQPFVSNAPVIGPLIVGFRTLWNWMSTQWYVTPLIQQQNEFNVTMTRTLREMVASVEALARSVQDMQTRIDAVPDQIPVDAAKKQE
jgi:hypothetical protein